MKKIKLQFNQDTYDTSIKFYCCEYLPIKYQLVVYKGVFLTYYYNEHQDEKIRQQLQIQHNVNLQNYKCARCSNFLIAPELGITIDSLNRLGGLVSIYKFLLENAPYEKLPINILAGSYTGTWV